MLTMTCAQSKSIVLFRSGDLSFPDARIQNFHREELGGNGNLKHEKKTRLAAREAEKSESFLRIHHPCGKMAALKNSQLKITNAHRVRVRGLDVEALEIPVDRDVPVWIHRVIGI
jgi:hypothetical protein